MEQAVVRKRGRPRKRRREEDEKEKIVSVFKRQAFDISWKPLVGRYLLKEFKGSGLYLGKVVYFDRGLYRVDFEDGDCEDLEGRELRDLIMWDNELSSDLSQRKWKLDELMREKHEKRRIESEKKDVRANGADMSGNINGEYSSDSCEYEQDEDFGAGEETPALPLLPPQLPLSSGTINVPEECVAQLFSVYLFLRSFSIRLFLYPFSLDDFVGALNCQVQNTLVDSIHVSLLWALRRHLESIASDGSEVPIRCLRYMDWSLLDLLTWPACMVHYFIAMGYAEGSEWTGFCDELVNTEYYNVPVDRKIRILQLLCDDVLDSAEFRAEINIWAEAEVGFDPDLLTSNLPETGPRRVHPRFSKTSACKHGENMELNSRRANTSRSFKCLGSGGMGGPDALDVDGDGNVDECRLCGMEGTLICCDGCPSAYHTRCVGLVKIQIPEGPWYCPECTIAKMEPSLTGTSLRGAEIFGTDPYEQVFLGTCNHLLVFSVGGEHCHRYYNENDVLQVLELLLGSTEHKAMYFEISMGIARHWYVLESFSDLSVPPCGQSQSQKTIDTSANATSHKDVKGSTNYMNDGENQILSNMNVMPANNVKVEPSDLAVQQADPSYVYQQMRKSFTEKSRVTECMSADGCCSDRNHISSHLPPVLYSLNKEGNIGLRRIEGKTTTNTLFTGTLFKPHLYINYYVHGEFAANAAARLAILSKESKGLEVHKSSNGRKVVSDISLQVKAFSAVASHFFWPCSEKKLVEVPRERCGWCHSCMLSSNSRRGCYLNAAASSATKGAWKVLSGLRPAINGEGSLRSISTYMLYLEEMLHGVTMGLFRTPSFRVQWHRRVEDAPSFLALKRPLLELEENVRVIALLGEWVKACDDSCFESSVISSAPLISSTAQKRGPNCKYQKKQIGVPDLIADDGGNNSFIWWQGGKQSNFIYNKAALPKAMVKRAAHQGGSRKMSGVFYPDDSEIPKRSRRVLWRAAIESCKNSAQLAFQVRYLDHHVRWNDLVRAEQNLQDVKGPETEASFFRNAIICDQKTEESRVRYGIDFKDQKHLPSRIMKNVIEVEKLEDGKLKYWFWEANIPLYLIKEYEEKVDSEELASAKRCSDQLSKLQRKQLGDSCKDIFTFLVCKRDKIEKCSCASCQKDVMLGIAVVCNACQGYCHEDCTKSSRVGTNHEVFTTCERCSIAKGFRHPEMIGHSPVTPLPQPLQMLAHNAETVLKTPKLNVYNQPLESFRIQETCSEMAIKKETHSEMVNKKKESRSEPKLHGSASEAKKRICNWGLIWKKKPDGPDPSGADFRNKNVLLKGNPDKSWLKPVCRSCQKEYSRDLMYIHCEKCKSWFHAEAVELEESRAPFLMGFKCCRCRRIKPPPCPYSDEPEKPVMQRSRNRPVKHDNELVKNSVRTSAEHGKLKLRGSKNFYEHDPARYMKEGVPSKNAVVHRSDRAVFGSIIADSKGSEPNTEVPFEEVFVQDDDPLLFSLSRVENIMEKDLVEYDTGSIGHGPQKLPVRRQSKYQGDDEASEDNLYQAELCIGLHNLISQELSSTCTEWAVPATDPQEETRIDCEGLNYEDLEFEPQTYFSFTELLDGEGGQSNSFDASATGLVNSNSPSSLILEDGDNCLIEANGDCFEPTASLGSRKDIYCKKCSGFDPVPDLCCEICGMTVHSHCLPWVESRPLEGSWRCGHCREWR